MRSDCRFTRVARLLAPFLLMLVVSVTAHAASFAIQEPAHAQPAAQAEAEHTSEGQEAHDAGWFPTIAKAFNFAVLVGVLGALPATTPLGLSVFANHTCARGPGGRCGDA